MNMLSLKNNQSGVALIIGLIFLLIMSIAGIGSIQKVTLQERISGNTIDNNRAFQAAEIALAAAELATVDNNFNRNNHFIRQITVANGWSAMTDEELLDPTNWDCDNPVLMDGVTANEMRLCTEQLAFRDTSITAIPQVKYEQIEADDRFIITVRVEGQGRSAVMLQSVYDQQ